MGTIDRNIDVTSSMYKPYDTMLMRKRRVSLLNQPSTSGESRMELADPTAAVTKFMPEKKGKQIHTSRNFYGRRATEAGITETRRGIESEVTTVAAASPHRPVDHGYNPHLLPHIVDAQVTLQKNMQITGAPLPMSTLTTAAGQSSFLMETGMPAHRVCLGGKKNTIMATSQASLAL